MGREEMQFWEARYWQAVTGREAEMDGAVYYGVISTGVYCRPSCPSRRPQRRNVVFFRRREEAERAGFRACLRCRPDRAAANPRVELVERVCRCLEARSEGSVTLADLGRELGLSPFHIQRTFKAVLGVSPRAWAEQRRLERFKNGARGGAQVTEALYEAGYGSSSRLYTRGTARLGMTPATYGRHGEGAAVAYTVVDGAPGKLLVAATGKGICAVRFGDSEAELEAGLRAEFSRAAVARNDEALAGYAGVLADALAGGADAASLPLDIRATAFQRRVWEALRSIPAGETRSYSEVARAIGEPGAVRAVASACAANPAALTVPCHRVVRQDGEAGEYRWGVERKRRLLERERVRCGAAEPV